MPNSRLPRASYNIMVELDLVGRVTWVTHVKNMLYKYGFVYVWEQQENLNAPLFLEEFKLRISDCLAQEWHAEVERNKKLGVYCLFKTELKSEIYLDKVIGRHFRSALARFRCSNHSLEIEVGRRNRVETEDRLCKLCLANGIQYIENELHFLLVCPSLHSLRIRFLPKIYYLTPSLELLSVLMSSKDITLLNKLARYVYFAMKKRVELISELM